MQGQTWIKVRSPFAIIILVLTTGASGHAESLGLTGFSQGLRGSTVDTYPINGTRVSQEPPDCLFGRQTPLNSAPTKVS
jgi:hypothetical protein